MGGDCSADAARGHGSKGTKHRGLSRPGERAYDHETMMTESAYLQLVDAGFKRVQDACGAVGPGDEGGRAGGGGGLCVPPPRPT